MGTSETGTGLEVLRMSDVKARRREVKDCYGPWMVNRKLMVLTSSVDLAGYGYEIDLEGITTPAQMLDVIMQIAEKTWATPEALGYLVVALNDIYRPQANLCSFGQSKAISNVATFLRKQFMRSVAGVR